MSKFKKYLGYVVSFGAQYRVDKAINSRRDKIAELCNLNKLIEEKRIIINQNLKDLINLKIYALKCLKKLSFFSKLVSIKKREIINSEFKNIEHVDFTPSDLSNSLALYKQYTKGIISGISTATGGWGLVATFGVASTGTSISTLSGAAATNATLAWFGGGSVATGGGGMAAGTVVLGTGIGVIFLGVSAAFIHVKAGKEIKLIKEDELKIIKAINESMKLLQNMDLLKSKVNEEILTLEKEVNLFNGALLKFKKEFYRFGWLSIIWKKILLWVFKKYSTEEANQLSFLILFAKNVLTLIDKKVINEDGNLI